MPFRTSRLIWGSSYLTIFLYGKDSRAIQIKCIICKKKLCWPNVSTRTDLHTCEYVTLVISSGYEFVEDDENISRRKIMRGSRCVAIHNWFWSIELFFEIDFFTQSKFLRWQIFQWRFKRFVRANYELTAMSMSFVDS